MSYVDPRNPNIIKMRAARELRTRKAIKRKEIRAQNPSITDAMLERVVQAQITQEDARAEQERQARRKPKGGKRTQGRKWNGRKPKSNNALTSQVREWKDTQEAEGKRFLKFHPAK